MAELPCQKKIKFEQKVALANLDWELESKGVYRKKNFKMQLGDHLPVTCQ
jgi:hypothetical protein